MRMSLKKSALGAASAILIALAAISWAVPIKGAAHRFLRRLRQSNNSAQSSDSPRLREPQSRAASRGLPGEVRFHDSPESGLLVNAWVNGVGPFNLAIDTGAGATYLSARLAQQASINVKSGRTINVSGLSGMGSVNGREAVVRSLAIGDQSNFLPGRGLVIVADSLPTDVDGILDPTEAYWPLGYTIDMPNSLIRAFDPHATPLRAGDAPPGGAVVPWLFDGESRRPYVMLSGGRRALLDTGSSFGLAISESAARSFGAEALQGKERFGAHDVGGGNIMAKRINPITVQVGPLTLYRVPTDLLIGADAGSPILIGREALEPFELSFDPVDRLIRFTPPRDNRDN